MNDRTQDEIMHSRDLREASYSLFYLEKPKGKNFPLPLAFNLPFQKILKDLTYFDKFSGGLFKQTNRNSLIQKLSSFQKEMRETEFQIPETKSTYNKNKIRTERQISLNLQFALLSQAPKYIPTIKTPKFSSQEQQPHAYGQHVWIF